MPKVLFLALFLSLLVSPISLAEELKPDQPAQEKHRTAETHDSKSRSRSWRHESAQELKRKPSAAKASFLVLVHAGIVSPIPFHQPSVQNLS